ncbi:uncharacterized protein FA14DRAFT_149963 [Meira miltonrushii]|uniref:DNA-directed RNA polymerase III subunit RPC9 n=1 Tax=Meira miltonrushii TaxID=1280837 RepID=A0A316V5Y6_9BASI|nr:uncharacterized protein FA14DRAFT_149963 [Meira miltonrushii]PWN31891.1 hypothetical protein FA14DRAFT_149963 [Meira miltonrushii]
MKVKNARAAELSDFEVLQVLREMGKRQQMAVLKKNIESTKVTTMNSIKPNTGTESLSIEERTMQSLPSNLRTIQYEVLECLRNVQRPCAHQSSDQIPRFMDALYAWERGKPVEGVPGLNEGGEDGGIITIIEREKRLTKGERLMLINHAPTTEIELYPLVEEIEDRFTADQRLDILTIISAHLPLDQEAIQAYQDRNTTMPANAEMNDQQDVVFDEQDGEEVYVGPEDEYEQQGIADPDDDMDMLQNEAAGGAAVDDDGPDE